MLHGLCRWHNLQDEAENATVDAVAEQLAATLVTRGLLVDRAVGQSHFRCDLAIRRPGDSVYRLGVLVDSDAYYEQADVLERDVMRPKLLRNFGWNICQVFAKDWYEARDRVVDRVLRLLAGETDCDMDGKTDEETPGATSEGSQDTGRSTAPELDLQADALPNEGERDGSIEASDAFHESALTSELPSTGRRCRLLGEQRGTSSSPTPSPKSSGKSRFAVTAIPCISAELAHGPRGGTFV